MMLTLSEVAADLRITERAVREMIKARKLHAVKAGIGVTSPWRISEEDLAEFKQQRAEPQAS